MFSLSPVCEVELSPLDKAAKILAAGPGTSEQECARLNEYFKFDTLASTHRCTVVVSETFAERLCAEHTTTGNSMVQVYDLCAEFEMRCLAESQACVQEFGSRKRAKDRMVAPKDLQKLGLAVIQSIHEPGQVFSTRDVETKCVGDIPSSTTWP
jgi:hypothetical protein